MNVEIKCPVCGGEGKRVLGEKTFNCPKCHGTGLDPSAITFNDPMDDDRRK